MLKGYAALNIVKKISW